MPRVGGFGGRGFGGRTSRSASHSNSPAPVPQPQPVQTPPPAQFGSSYGGYGFGSFGSTLTGVMIWCFGLVIAMRTVDSFWGPRTIKVNTVGSEKAKSSSMFSSTSKGDACGMQLKAFQDCLKSCDGDISKCQFYTDMLAECQKNSG